MIKILLMTFKYTINIMSQKHFVIIYERLILKHR